VFENIALNNNGIGGMNMPKIFLQLTALACLAVFASAQATAKDLTGWGAVVMHGKGGGTGGVSSVSSALSAAGAKVVKPSMSWSSGYRTYSQSLDEVAGHIASLKAQGATRIALVGHSLGANVALGYGAQRGGVAAVVAIGPGHQPDKFVRQPEIRDSLDRAKKMVASGQGAQSASFADSNQGRSSQVNTTAAAYVSFFDPAGPAVMGRNSGSLRGAKLLWVVGSGDPGARSVAHGGTVINVSAGHFDTPSAGAAQIVSWLEKQ
jgi:pimeloyl-ACP methyl ester carboxylesterase